MSEFTYLTTIPDTSDTDVYTQSAVSLGAADSDRHIIVGITGRKAGAATTISSVTVGGVSADIVTQFSNSDTNSDICGIAIANVPSGTTGDIVVTFAASLVRAAFTVWRAVGFDFSAPLDFDTDGSTNPTVNVDVEDGGFLVATALSNNNGSTTTWTGATEQSDQTLETYVTISDAHYEPTADETGRTVTATFGASGSTPVMAVASWSPATGISINAGSSVKGTGVRITL